MISKRRPDIDDVKARLDLPKDEEDFYLDAYKKRISFKGVRTLKKAFTKLPLTKEHIEEIVKCAQDFNYFRDNYCIILTKTGYDYVEPREYQQRFCDALVNKHRIATLFGRQSGKCSEKTTLITVRNKKLGIPEMKVSVETMHNINTIMMYSANKERVRKVTFETLSKTKPFEGVNFDSLDDELKIRLEELLNVINSMSLNYKGHWIRGFIDNKLTDNLVLRVCNIHKYIENNKSFDSLEYFTLLYGEETGIEKWNYKCDRFKGENNPGYKHNGRLSPFSLKSEKHNIDNIELIRNKIKKTKENPIKRGNRNKFYWIEKGLSESDAIKKVKELQTTFSYDKCILKYGKIEGEKKFNERQVKWLKTIDSLPEDKKNEMNRKKGININAGYGLSKIRKNKSKALETDSFLYYIRFFNSEIEFWKVGVAKKGVDSRFGSEDLFYKKTGLKREVITVKKTNWYDAFLSEQTLLKMNKDKRIKIDLEGFKSGECFSEAIDFNDINKTVYADLEAKI